MLLHTYIRWETGNKKVFLRLIASKNRIAPIKIMDMVRLELCGAVLSTRLRRFIQREMRFEFRNIFHIVDSEIVKAMISKNSFVANRLGEIHSNTNKEEWYWTPGKLSIADWVTRGKRPDEIDRGSEWQGGGGGEPFLQGIYRNGLYLNRLT